MEGLTKEETGVGRGVTRCYNTLREELLWGYKEGLKGTERDYKGRERNELRRGSTEKKWLAWIRSEPPASKFKGVSTARDAAADRAPFTTVRPLPVMMTASSGKLCNCAIARIVFTYTVLV
jgi:hypothetical protein